MKDCTKCGEEVIELPLSSDPEGFRLDYFCGECNTRFGTSKSGNFIVSEPCNTAKVVEENKELKITIRTMMKLKEKDS